MVLPEADETYFYFIFTGFISHFTLVSYYIYDSLENLIILWSFSLFLISFKILYEKSDPVSVPRHRKSLGLRTKTPRISLYSVQNDLFFTVEKT